MINIIIKRLTRSKVTVIVYVLIACVVLGTGLKPGQLFLLDMPWPEHIQLSAYLKDGVPLHAPLLVVLWLANLVIPMWVLQKLLLISLLAMAGIGMHRLLRSIGRTTNTNAYIGGVLFLANPYPIDRLLSGQWLVLAGYSFLPFFAACLWAAHKRPSKKTVFLATSSWVTYLFISVHFWYMVSLLLAPYVVFVFVRHVFPKKLYKHVKALDVSIVILATIALVSIAAWQYLDRIKIYEQADFLAFATRGLDSFGGFITVLSLRGFWYSNGLVPLALTGMWVVLCFTALLLVVYAAVVLARSHKMAVWYGATCFVLVTIVATGYAGTGSQAVVDVLRHIPGFNGLRETQKFVGLIAFAYALAVPYSFGHLTNRYKKAALLQFAAYTVVGLYVFVLAITVQASSPRLRTYSYPTDWQQVRTTIINDSSVRKVLVVPWDGYVVLPFANGAYAANPARVYFGSKVNTRSNSDNKLLDDARGLSATDTAALRLTVSAQSIPTLKSLGYTHILVLHIQDYQSYQKTLSNNPELEVIFRGTALTYYKIL